MGTLPSLSGQQVCRALEQAGFLRRSQKGSHVKMRHADGRCAIVPLNDDLAPGTLRSILKQADLVAGDLVALLR